jgi:EARP and GARP complex-interacting protein 1
MGMEDEGYGSAVWKIPELYGQSNSPQLEQLFTLDGHTGKIRRYCPVYVDLL